MSKKDALPSFNDNYRTLKDIADNLRQQSGSEVPDIDNLLPMVEKATLAYKACKERLDAVQSALIELESNSTNDQEAGGLNIDNTEEPDSPF